MKYIPANAYLLKQRDPVGINSSTKNKAASRQHYINPP